MRYIKDLKEGDRVREIYFCKHKQSAMTKNGKPYETVTLQDKTGTMDGKIWDLNSFGIADFDAMDYIDVTGEVTSFNNALQINIRGLRVCAEGEYDAADYMPMTEKNIDEMYEELLWLIGSIENPYYKTLLENIFIVDQDFVKRFRTASAAKTVHHAFVGGLLEHTLSVTKLCDYYCKNYPVLRRDLLLCAAMCHDIGKTAEIAAFPINDYTDDGQLLGHIVIGSQMVAERAAGIAGFPHGLLSQLQHCILAHHGKYEFGSPKLPALIEAVALNYADDTDAKLETFKEILVKNTQRGSDWFGYNGLFESNLRATRDYIS